MATSPSLNFALNQLTAQIASMQADIAQLKRNARSAQLGNSSIDDGTLIINDSDGNPQIALGKQPDGTYAHVALTGTGPPPVPSDPIVAPGPAGLYVNWDGTMAGGTPPLSDFAALQVHCSPGSGFTPSSATLQGTMTTAGLFGVGNLTPLTTYYVVFVSVNAAGQTSDPSDQVSGVPQSVLGAIGPGSIDGTAIVTGTITAAQIAAAAAITGSQLATGTVTAAQIAGGTITAAELAAGIVYATIVDGTTITGATFAATGVAGQFLGYAGDAALGNLVAWLSPTAGNDVYGNTFTAGFGVGLPGGSQVQLNPSVSSQFSVATAIGGVLEAAMALLTDDPAQVIPGLVGSLLLGSGGATKMATALTSPIGAGSGSAMLLQAQNDGLSDSPVITFGTVTTPDSSTEVFSPLATVTPYAFIVYAGDSGTTVVTKTSGSGTIAIPAGVTMGSGECWGGGASGAGSEHFYYGLGAAGGGGGGEYACEPSLALTSGGTCAYAVGAGGASVSGISNGNTGANTTLTGSSATVTAHGGPVGGTSPGGTGSLAGGTGSANTVHFDGGASAAGGSFDGGGGGGGGGVTGPGGIASSPAGAPGGPGGGTGGDGGLTTTSGRDGGLPGGGGGGAGTPQAAGASSSGAGGSGMVRLTYSTGAPPVLFSVASASGVDQFGSTYPAGMSVNAGAQPIAATVSGVAEVWHYVGTGSGIGTTFGTDWSNRGGTSPAWAKLAFRLLASPPSSAEIRGWVQASSDAASGTLFTLPSGYQPVSEQTIVGWVNTPGNGVAVTWNITPAGLVQLAAGVPTWSSGAVNFWLDGIFSLDI